MKSRMHMASRPARAQRGAALVVGLILLLVLTMLAVASMSGATLGLQMTVNAQSAANAFQAAERGVDVAMQTTWLDTSTAVVDDVEQDIADTSDRFLYEVRFNQNNGVTNPPPEEGSGYSMFEGGGFKAFHFDVVATGESVRGASVTTTQSFYKVVASGS